jgi:tetratricopeptide (TPR) repeat protein
MQNSDAPRSTPRRRLFSLALCALLAAAPAAADELQEANQLLKAGQRPQALERVNKALAAKPRDPQARFLKAVILTEQGNTKEAIEIFTRLTQDFPELPEPYNNLAVIYAAQGQYEKARAALEQSIRTHPSYATAYENLGDVYAKLASQAYDKALQLDKTNTGAQNKLSLVREISRGPTVLAAAAPQEPEKPKAAAVEKPKVAAVEEPKPAVQDPKPAGPDPSAEVLQAVNAWAQAWSNRDVDAYLAHYAKDFKTPRGQDRAAWEKIRRARIGGAKSISVGIEAPKVAIRNADHATVTFRQTYRSDTFKSNSRKTLQLIRSDGRWLILDEDSG